MDFEAIKKAAQGYQADMTRFLRDMIAIPSESCEEKGVANRIAEEMKKLGYDKVEFDKLGNVIGWMGTGDKIIALDSHIDTVGIGNIENWTHDPYQGYEDDEGHLRPRRLRPGGRHGLRHLRREDHEGPRPHPRGLQDHGRRLRAGGGLRRYVLAVHRQRILQGSRGRARPDRVRHLHRAHRRRHLPRSPRPHGDPRRYARRLLPRLRARARRQRHSQDG